MALQPPSIARSSASPITGTLHALDHNPRRGFVCVSMKLLPRLLLVSLFFSFAISAAHAVSTLSPIKPDKMEVGNFAFVIKAEQLKDGGAQFTVVITPSAGKVFGRGGTETGLGIVKITPNSQSITGGRSLEAKKSVESITCVFAVSAKDLADKDLSFVFTQNTGFEQDGKFVPMPSATMCYARLNDFIKP